MPDLLLEVTQLLPDVETLLELGRVGGVATIFAYSVLWLLRRGDEIQKDNMKVLVRQRDDALDRLEQCERQRLEEREQHHRIVDQLRSRIARAEGMTTGEIRLPSEEDLT